VTETKKIITQITTEPKFKSFKHELIIGQHLAIFPAKYLSETLKIQWKKKKLLYFLVVVF
jgi:hypothetical protein